MSWRFRKRLRVCKGIWVNVAKQGASLSVGGRGATANFNTKGTMGTFSAPGTGLSYRTKRYPYTGSWRHGRPSGQAAGAPAKSTAQRIAVGLAWAAWLSIVYFVVAYVLYFMTGGQ